MAKVTTGWYNGSDRRRYYMLYNVHTGDVLVAAPNNWKTEKGALRWALAAGHDIPAYKKKLLQAKPKTKRRTKPKTK